MNAQGNAAATPLPDLTSLRPGASAPSLAWAAIAGPLLFTAAWMLLGLLRPSYSFISQPISVLGVGRHAALMNGAFVLMGLLTVVGVVGIFRSIRELGNVARVACTLLLGASGMGGVLCGVFTYQAAPFPHFLGFLLAVEFPVAGLLVTGIVFRRIPRWRRFGGWLILAGPLTFALDWLCGANFDIARVEAGVGVAGLTERMAVLQLQWWYVALAWLAIRPGGAAARLKLVPEMEGRVARWYARQRGTESQLATWRKQARELTASLPDGAAVLEVAPGPGYLSVEIARLGRFHLAGLDISRTFVEIGKENAKRAGVVVDFRQGDAADMPFESGSFDRVICQAAFKNFRRPLAVLHEMHRALKPGGLAVIQDLSRDASREDIAREVESMKLSRWNSFVTRLVLGTMLRSRAYSTAELERLLAQSAFRVGDIRPDGIGLEARLLKPGSE